MPTLVMQWEIVYTLAHGYMSANQFCCFKVFNTAVMTEVAFSPTTLFFPSLSLT